MNTSNSNLEFEKSAMIGSIVDRQINTTVSILETSLHIRKITKKLLRSEQIEERDFNIADITSVDVHTALDFWDTLYAVIFAVLGFSTNPLLFIISVICLWCGYGKVIQLAIKTGEKYKIPLKGSNQEIDILLNVCTNSK